MGGQINVEVDTKPQADISAILSQVRDQYENVAKKNNADVETWFRQKVRQDQHQNNHFVIVYLAL